jgi:threonine/homoserine efflux transporter RhtA
MRANFARAIQLFFSPETLVPFFIGAIFLSVLGDAITQLLFNLFGTDTQAVVRIIIGSLLIFAVSVWWLAKRIATLKILKAW